MENYWPRVKIDMIYIYHLSSRFFLLRTFNDSFIVLCMLSDKYEANLCEYFYIVSLYLFLLLEESGVPGENHRPVASY
jgi:hypothetical protein